MVISNFKIHTFHYSRRSNTCFSGDGKQTIATQWRCLQECMKLVSCMGSHVYMGSRVYAIVRNINLDVYKIDLIKVMKYDTGYSD